MKFALLNFELNGGWKMVDVGDAAKQINWKKKFEMKQNQYDFII